jgi:hypothetical protein
MAMLSDGILWLDIVLFLYFTICIHSFNQILTTFIRRHSPRSISISTSLVISVGKPPCGAEPRIELGPALQQADALPTEQRRTIGHSYNDDFPEIFVERISPASLLLLLLFPTFLAVTVLDPDPILRF